MRNAGRQGAGGAWLDRRLGQLAYEHNNHLLSLVNYIILHPGAGRDASPQAHNVGAARTASLLIITKSLSFAERHRQSNNSTQLLFDAR